MEGRFLGDFRGDSRASGDRAEATFLEMSSSGIRLFVGLSSSGVSGVPGMGERTVDVKALPVTGGFETGFGTGDQDGGLAACRAAILLLEAATSG